MAEIKDDIEATLLPAPDDLPRSETRLRRTSTSRLEQSPVDADADAADDDASSRNGGPNTILYLAFGSNMCAATFLGKRGIRPLSAVNVTAPTLRLTFSIPGLPYAEPCFANTAPRKIPEVPIPELPRKEPPTVADGEGEEGEAGREGEEERGEPRWEKGLVGVVYEVTREDYKKIIATEGGGASYKEILAPCLAIPPRVGVPENPGGAVPRPFLARTLCMPYIPPPAPSDGGGAAERGSAIAAADDDNDRGGKKEKKGWWWWWLTKSGQRPLEDYAQPSERYLDLLRTGAAEHELPDEYQAYLGALRAYTPAGARQTAGKYVVLLLWGPPILLVFGLGERLADGDGRAPPWLAAVSTVSFRAMWWSYDVVFRRVFGEGERTVVGEGAREEAWWRWRARGRGPIRLKD